MAEKELDYSGIISINAEGDRATSLLIGVYQGNASLVVFSNKKPAARFPFPRGFITKLRLTLIGLVAAAPSTKINFSFSKYDPETKKSNNTGNFVIGKDDKGLIFFGIQSPNNPAMKFPLKSPMGFDTSDPMSDQDRSVLAANTIIDQLHTDIPLAMMMTKYKRDPNAGGRSGGYSSGSSGGDIF